MLVFRGEQGEKLSTGRPLPSPISKPQVSISYCLYKCYKMPPQQTRAYTRAQTLSTFPKKYMLINLNRQQLCQHTLTGWDNYFYYTCKDDPDPGIILPRIRDSVSGFTAATARHNVGGMRKVLLNEPRTSGNISSLPPSCQCNLLPAQWIVTVPPQDRLHWWEAPERRRLLRAQFHLTHRSLWGVCNLFAQQIYEE